MTTVSRLEVEGRVARAVRAVLDGNHQEDDRIEFKRSWPEPEKARQLAGAANRAAGDPVIWVIGVDERERKLYATGDTDPATWWPRLAKKFDEKPPVLEVNVQVFITETEPITALVFSTQDYPYVFKSDNDNRDVPMREGTRTRSAHRHELIDLLYPHAAVPPAELRSASLSAQWLAAIKPDARGSGRAESISLSGHARVFLEHSPPDLVYLPSHRMAGEVVIGKDSLPCAVSVHRGKDAQDPSYGVWIRQGVQANASGTFGVYLSVSVDLGTHDLLKQLQEIPLNLSFGVARVSKSIDLTTVLRRNLQRAERAGELFAILGEWAAGESLP